MEHVLRPIAHYRGDFPEKFGIPRQAGVAEALEGLVVFTEDWRNRDALRGIEGFSHLWLIWQFSENLRDEYAPTVRPPRLGGNERVGVFASRSPFRPNALGLSCVELAAVEERPGLGAVLRVRGADLMDGTPIFDVKPYLPYADAHPEARAGFAPDKGRQLAVDLPEALAAPIPPEKRAALIAVLANDPRPRYHRDPERLYALRWAGFVVRFRVEGDTLTVAAVEKDDR